MNYLDLGDALEFIFAVMFPFIATICGVTAIILSVTR